MEFAKRQGVRLFASVLVTGEFELTVPEVTAFEISGEIKPPLSAKDVILHVLGRFGPEGMKGRAAVFTGGGPMAGANLDERVVGALISWFFFTVLRVP